MRACPADAAVRLQLADHADGSERRAAGAVVRAGWRLLTGRFRYLLALALAWPGLAAAAGRDDAAALIQALRDPDPVRLEGFVATHFSDGALSEFSPAAWAHSLAVLARESGGLDDWSLGGDTDDVTIVGRARRIGLPVTGHVWLAHDKIAGFQLIRDRRVRSDDAPVWPDRVAGQVELVAAIERELDWQRTADRFSGVVLVAYGDRILLDRAAGWVDAARTRAIRISDRFSLASLNKMFTAVAVAQLVEAGRLSLDESIARLLPDYPDPALAGRITPRQLLRHTSGLGELGRGADVWHDFERDVGPRRMLRHLGSVPQVFPPGTGYRYSSAGFLVLGALIEAAGGEAYKDRIRTHVFAPAGMADALFPTPGQRPSRAVEGLTVAPDDPLGLRQRIGNGGAVPVFSGPASGAYATADDLFHFMRALVAGRLISAATLADFTAGQSPTWDRLGLYAQGFIERRTPAGRMFGHAGGAGAAGINDVVWTSGDGAWTVVVLSNYDAPAAVDLGTRIMDFVMANPSCCGENVPPSSL